MPAPNPWQCLLDGSSSRGSLSLLLCTKTRCLSCDGFPQTCKHGHTFSPITLAKGAPEPPAGAKLFCPEDMESAGNAQAAVIHYSKQQFGKGMHGPPTLESIVSFCRELRAALEESPVAVFCSDLSWACANTMLLVGAYLILEEGLTAEEALKLFPEKVLNRLYPKPWSEELVIHRHSLTVDDCLEGLEAAIRHSWLDYRNFSAEQWHSDLKTYDASHVLTLKMLQTKLHFWAIADPVTTVADPQIRPKPPKSGFIEDYEEIQTPMATPNADFPRQHSYDVSSSPSSRKAFEHAARIGVMPKPRRKTLGSADVSFEGIKSALMEACGDELTRDPDSPSISEVSIPHRRAVSEAQQTPSPTNSLYTVGLDPDTPDRVSPTNSPHSVISPPHAPGSGVWLKQVRVQKWGKEEQAQQRSNGFTGVKSRGVSTLPEYANWLQTKGCTMLVRLNFTSGEHGLPESGSYGDYFESWNIVSQDLGFEDGSVPSPAVVESFRKTVQLLQARASTAELAVAIHCTAGLGRTMTLIGAFATEAFNISGGAWLGWARMCRPGSVQTVAQESFIKGGREEARAALRWDLASLGLSFLGRICGGGQTHPAVHASPGSTGVSTGLGLPSKRPSPAQDNPEPAVPEQPEDEDEEEIIVRSFLKDNPEPAVPEQPEDEDEEEIIVRV